MVKNDEFPLVDSAEYSIVARRFEEFNNKEKISAVNKVKLVLFK